MSGYKDKGFSDRQKSSADAKKALLEKFRSKPGPDDPEFVARQQERLAIAAARDARMAERRAALEAAEAERQAELARIQAEEDARKAALRETEIELLAKQKAARDARYAARKSRR